MMHDSPKQNHLQIPLIRYLVDAVLPRDAKGNSPKKKNAAGGGRMGRAAHKGRLNGGQDNALDTNGSNDHTAR